MDRFRLLTENPHPPYKTGKSYVLPTEYAGRERDSLGGPLTRIIKLVSLRYLTRRK